MSRKEINRLGTLEKRARGELSQIEAADVLGLTTRQLRRLEKRFKDGGAEGIIHRGRGRKIGRRIDPGALEKLTELLKDPLYFDYGPTLLSEEVGRLGFQISKETVRQEMINRKKWQTGKAAPPRVHRQRPPRAKRGELLQADGSKHAWFEDRGPTCSLLVAIDDATSAIESMRFRLQEDGAGYRDLFLDCFERNGMPIAIYSDRHAIFKVNHPECLDRSTHFKSAMEKLGVTIICARSPQAKGRVERCNGTLQDRLVKWLRQRGISTIEEANQRIEEYRIEHNKRFARPAHDSQSAYRPMKNKEAVKQAFLRQATRQVAKDLTFSFLGTYYQIRDVSIANRLRGKRVTISYDEKVIYKVDIDGKELNWEVLKKCVEAVPVVSGKELPDELSKTAQAWIKRKAPATAIERHRRSTKGGKR